MLRLLQVDWPCLQGPLSPGHHEHPLLPKPLLSPWLVGAPLWDKIGGSGKAGGQTADSWGLGSAPPAPPKLVLQSLQGLGAKLGHLELFSPADPAAQVATAKSAEDPISSRWRLDIIRSWLRAPLRCLCPVPGTELLMRAPKAGALQKRPGGVGLL